MRRRYSGGVAAAVGVLLALVLVASAALAAGQVKGGSYKGSLAAPKQGIGVSFKVSGNGKRVSSLQISTIPIYCSGGGPATPIHFKNAAISSKGTFTSSARYVIKIGPFKGQVGETFKISGKFLKGRRERGTLTTTYPKDRACGGSSSYTTKA